MPKVTLRIWNNAGNHTQDPELPLLGSLWSQPPGLFTAIWGLVKGKRSEGKFGPFLEGCGEKLGWERKGSTYNPKPAFSRKGCFQLSWGKGGFAFLGVRTLAFSTSGQR